MKKKSFYLFAIMMVAMLCAGFTSCGDDDNDEPGGNGIIGTWQFIRGEEYNENGELVDVEDIAADGDLIYQFFKADGTAGTCQYFDKTIDNYANEWETRYYTYTIDGNRLVVTVSGMSGSVEIISLSATDLTLRMKIRDGYRLEKYKRVKDAVIADALK